jgi:hypothetical protein
VSDELKEVAKAIVESKEPPEAKPKSVLDQIAAAYERGIADERGTRAEDDLSDDPLEWTYDQVKRLRNEGTFMKRIREAQAKKAKK